MAYRVTVNGKARTVDVEQGTPLLWVLRDTIGLVGTKFGCGCGLCGCCTVQLDGKPVRACQTAIESVGPKAVTTIEGIGDTEAGKKIQAAWIDIDVPQCGYCQAGQIMSASALIARTPKPSDDDIDKAMSGNICRCATYTRIRAAIHQAAGQTPAAGPPEPELV